MQFEIKKIFKSTYFWFLILAYLLFFLTYYIYAYINTNQLENEIWRLEEALHRTEQAISDYETALKSAEGAGAAEIEKTIKFENDALIARIKTLEYYKKEDWAALLQQDIDEIEPIIRQMESSNQTHTYTWPTLFNLETYIEKNKWMIEKGVQPLFPMDMYSYLTLYDREFLVEGATQEEVRELHEESNNKYSSASTHYLDKFFRFLFSILGAVFFLFLFADILTKEGLRRNGPIHLLRTQPIHRDKVLAGKFLTVLIISFMILLVTIILSLILGILFEGLGDWDYPVLIYGEDRSFRFISMGIFLVIASSMFLMILFLCYTILFLFSVLTTRVLVTIGLTLATIFIGIQLSEEMITASFAHYLPFHYFSVFDIITNEYAVSVDNYQFTYQNGMLSLGLTSLFILIITYVISTFLYNKND